MKNRIVFVIDKLFELHGLSATEGPDCSQVMESTSPEYINDVSCITEDMVFQSLNAEELISRAKELEKTFEKTDNRYQKVQAAIFLSRLYGYYLPNRRELLNIGTVLYSAIKALEDQQFDKALEELYKEINRTVSVPCCRSMNNWIYPKRQ